MNAERVEQIGPQESHPFVDLLNEDGAEFARENTEAASQKAIDLIYNNVAFRLKQDAMMPEETEAYVQHDILTAPMDEQNDPVDTFCVRLEAKFSHEDLVDDTKYLELHIPSGAADVDLYQMPPKFDVKEVYIAVVGDEKHWFALTQQGVYEYIPRAEQDDPMDAVLNDQGVWMGFDERIPESYLVMHRLFYRIVNWQTVKQPPSATDQVK